MSPASVAHLHAGHRGYPDQVVIKIPPPKMMMRAGRVNAILLLLLQKKKPKMNLSWAGYYNQFNREHKINAYLKKLKALGKLRQSPSDLTGKV